MKTFARSNRALRCTAALLLLLSPVAPAYARVHHSSDWARTQFEAAERMREALNGRPAEDRSRREYQRVINAYRRIYFAAPAAGKADPSVVAVAELMVEMGRRFEDRQTLHQAIKQYQFLRREYPGSKYRFDALFTIGEIYKDDLSDPARAREVFEEFVHRYPRNRLAAEARQALAEPVQLAAQIEKDPKKDNNDKNNKTQKGDRDKDNDKKDRNDGTDAKVAGSSVSNGGNPANGFAEVLGKAGQLPRVTAIRHWSTPDYTRVAIDVEQDIQFESQRIDRPDRIFFDLLQTKIASTLVGKSFDVDDGFLKKIRIAQFEPGKTRVVLEVDSLSDYDAFLLPNPPRLIIDIHGADTHRKSAATTDVKTILVKSAGGPALVATSSPSVSAADSKQVEVTPPAPHATTPLLNTEVATTKSDTPKPTQIVFAKVEPPPMPQQVASPVAATRTEVKVVESKKTAANIAPAVLSSAASPKKSSAKAEVKTEVADKSATGAVDSSERAKTSFAKGVKKRKTKAPDDEFDVREAQPTADGDRSLTRALGLKIGKIVIDPGHGGHDTGTIGPEGLKEKDLVLDVGKRLGKLLETRLGAEVVYTRSDDTFIPLETRTAIANQEQSDLFVSIHANSSRDPDARGVETYYLNFTSSSEALEVAARENAVSEKSIHELQDLVKKIALKEKIEESREFASDVQTALHSGLAAKNPGLRNRGVKKAPFIVLIGANMPSILAEISFVSNPADERKLETPEYRQKIAESLYRGMAKYVGGLSGVKVASKMDKGAGQ